MQTKKFFLKTVYSSTVNRAAIIRALSKHKTLLEHEFGNCRVGISYSMQPSLFRLHYKHLSLIHI